MSIRTLLKNLRSPRFRRAFRHATSLASIVLTLLVCCCAAVRAQDQQPSPNEPQLHHLPAATAGAAVARGSPVTIYATVRDKHGKIVPNLTKDDFVVEEDGRPQTIAQFVAQTDVPLTVGLLIDTTASQRAVLVPERDSSFTFLDHLLTAKDVAFIIHFDREVELLQDLTSSRPKLQSALQLLQPAQNTTDRNSTSGGGQRQSRERRHLYDAIWLASTQMMKKQQGRKELFVLSNGVDRGSRESLTDAIEAAQRADIAVYTIYLGGEESDERDSTRRGRWGAGGPVGWPGGGYPGGGGNPYPREPRELRVDGKRILLQISEQTGGMMFEVSKKLPLDRIFSVAAEGLRNQYSLSYTPNPPDGDTGFHTIHLTAKKKDLAVQARQGYYSGQ
jgi:VWFA-related protein